MIQMKWRADSENSENSALDTIIVTHKIYEKKYFLIGLTLLRRIEQLNTLLVYWVVVPSSTAVSIIIYTGIYLVYLLCVYISVKIQNNYTKEIK